MEDTIFHRILESISNTIYVFNRKWRYLPVNRAGTHFVEIKKGGYAG